MSERLTFMSDDRYRDLINAADECIDLIKVGADEHEALRQLVDKYDLSPHEARLVAHAVNNSRQVALLQNGDRDGFAVGMVAFQVIDPERVMRTIDTSGKVIAISDDDDDDAETRGADDTSSDRDHHAAASYDTHTAKQAAEAIRSRLAEQEAVDRVQQLKQAWQIPDALPYLCYEPEDTSDEYAQLLADEARTKYAHALHCAHEAIDSVRDAIEIGEVSPQRVAELCAYAGIDAAVTAAIVGGRELVKQAGASEDRVQVTEDEFHVVQLAEYAERMIKHAIDCLAVSQAMQRCAFEKAAAVASDMVAYSVPSVASFDALFSSLVPTPSVIDAAISAVEDEEERKEVLKAVRNVKNRTVSRSEALDAAIEASDDLNMLFNDEVLKKAPPLMVIKSYQRAKSLPVELSKPDLLAFVRQDVSSNFAVPLDLLLKIRRSRERTDDED